MRKNIGKSWKTNTEENKMKIDIAKFKSFVEKVTMDSSIGMAVLEFTESGMKVKSKTLDNAGAGIGLLMPGAFQGYQPIGLVGIKNINKLLRMLKALKGTIVLEMQGNKFVMHSDTFTFSVTMATTEYIDNYLEQEPSMEFDGGVVMDSTILKEALTGKEIVDGDYLVMECKDRKLSITSGEANSDRGIAKANCDYKDFRSSYGSVLDSAIKVLSGKVNMACANDYPIQLQESREDYVVKLVMAPVDEEKVEDMKPEMVQDESNGESEPTEEQVEAEAPATQ